MRSTLALLVAALLPLSVHAETPGETRWRADISNGFSRMERAWAAYQLQAVSALYDVGDVVSPAALPTPPADVFGQYKLKPGTRDDRTFTLTGATETSVTVCVDAVIKSSDELNGFLLGMRQSKADVATNDCQPGMVNAAIGFPTHIYARKVVDAKRAKAVWDQDKAERAAWAAVAPVVTFAFPSDSKLLDFAAQVSRASVDKAVVLTNQSASLWSVNPPVILDGPFAAATVGCDAVAPTGSCTLYVNFQPTAAGKSTGHVKVTTSTGQDLILRLAGTATP